MLHVQPPIIVGKETQSQFIHIYSQKAFGDILHI
jgi:hypothetical protein